MEENLKETTETLEKEVVVEDKSPLARYKKYIDKHSGKEFILSPPVGPFKSVLKLGNTFYGRDSNGSLKNIKNIDDNKMYLLINEQIKNKEV